MAFKRHRIEKIHGFMPAAMEARTLSFYRYFTADDTIAQVAAAGYFNGLKERGLQVGDLMEAHCTNGVQVFVIATIPAGDVTVKKTGSASGQHVTVDENDTIVTGLTTVLAVVAQLDDDPVDGCMHVTASIGDQAGAPAAGSILIKTWKSTDGDATLIAATTFGKKVNWFAFGK